MTAAPSTVETTEVITPARGVVDLSMFRECGARLVRAQSIVGTPDDRGVLQEWRVALPAFDRSAYFAGAQKYGIDPSRVTWPDGCNQLQPLVVDELCELKEGGLMIVARLQSGDVLCALPIAGERACAWFGSEPHDLTLRAGTLGHAEFEGAIDLLAVAVAACPVSACAQAWEVAREAPSVRGRLSLRREKRFPEVFESLGWCSWEAFRAEIDERCIAESFDGIRRSRVPVRWAIIDDGWLDGMSTRHTDPRRCDDRALLSFDPHPSRFPSGFADLIARARVAGVERMGLWLNFNGYWEGLHADHRIDKLRAHLTEVRPGVFQPSPDAEASRVFYDAMVGGAADAGFDFVKVDNQAANLNFYRGAVGNAAQAAATNSASLESAAAARFDAMINCMAHNNTCAFSTAHSAVTRCSEDYLKGDEWRAKMHLYHSFANMLYFGPTVWGDHDMFHSSDVVAGGVMARSKAISGGPIYLSDEPDAFVREIIDPLVLPSGRVLRPIAPAAPLPDSVFINPYTDGQAFRVVAPLANGAAAVCAYNLTTPGVPVDAMFAATDYPSAGTMLDDPGQWHEPTEGLLLYEPAAGALARLDDLSSTVKIPPIGDRFALMLPRRCGWAVLGALEMYLSPAACRVLIASQGEVVIRALESLAITVWCDGAAVVCDAGELILRDEPPGTVTVAPDARGMIRLRRSS
ncbi:MAG: Sip1-related alpha-galactosidase [Planctomycetota bacterium]